MERESIDDFVATRSTRLLRTAYLLTHDRALAEDLVQASLAKAWFAWGGLTTTAQPPRAEGTVTLRHEGAVPSSGVRLVAIYTLAQ